MKARLDAIVKAEQAEYLDRLLPSNTGVLAEMEAYAEANRVPIADREVARFLEITARSIGARRALEIGMAIGYSVIHLARGMGEGSEVVTIEPSEEMIARSEEFVGRAGLRERLRIERGFALEVLPRLSGETFDLVFLDAL
jgi:predicted O-methyltransferase YrrM